MLESLRRTIHDYRQARRFGKPIGESIDHALFGNPFDGLEMGFIETFLGRRVRRGEDPYQTLREEEEIRRLPPDLRPAAQQAIERGYVKVAPESDESVRKWLKSRPNLFAYDF
jgi:hypothetical protein